MPESSGATGSAAAGLAAAALRHIGEAQARHRLPGVAASVAGPEGLLWSGAVGLADVEAERPATADTQFRVGSITKTFTAVAILRLRDAGRLRLDDPVAAHVPEVGAWPVTLRQLLTHASGLQREPPGRVWERTRMPSVAEFLASAADAERVLEPDEHWHYSNLGFALLGEVVARTAGRPYTAVVEEELLRPLGLHRTGWGPEEPCATGYLVDPRTETVQVEPALELDGLAAAGQLWSTTEDLCRWGLFLTAPDPAVLRRETADEMLRLRIMSDPERWTQGWGLGLMLWRRGERFFAGHLGGMPGHRAALVVSRSERRAAAVLVNATGGGEIGEIGLDLLQLAIDREPASPVPWRPGQRPPAAVSDILGAWWSEGVEHAFVHRAGRLEARPADRPGDDPSVFVALGPDLFRTAAGPERGERLEVERDPEGRVVCLRWATYRFDRGPSPFGPGPGPGTA